MNTTPSGLKRVIGQTTVIAAAAFLALSVSPAQAGIAFPTKATPQAHDLGAATDASITVTVALKNRNAEELKILIADLHTPGNASFHKFLSADEFHKRFDPSPESIAAATKYFGKAGLSVSRAGGHLLEVTGSAKALASAFNVSLHQFEVPAHGKNAAFRFHAALGEPSIAQADVAASVTAVIGLDNHPHYAPNMTKAAAAAKHIAPQAARMTAGNAPGQWTVNDLSAYYNVNPLYAAGIHGEGKTIGIVTLASFTPSDAFTYWNENGLTTDANRIKIIEIDGGSGPISDGGGSGETTLDVEQSGGMAPAANILVYEAPNTDKSFVHAFAKAVNDNIADSISVSWGSFEWFETLSKTKAKRGNVTTLRAFNQIFMQAAAQGQSLIAAQGDEGSYEANRAAPYPYYDKIISVGAPASSPYITSAGGTTLPGTLVFNVGGQPFPITVATEQAWGWSYLTPLCTALGLDVYSCGIWGVGGGGGVSAAFPMPGYQKHVGGMEVTVAGQSLIDETTTPPTDYVDLPAGYAGRNVPDVSLNADPETGYSLDYTDETGVFGVTDFYGGTSFVSPQLNGIAALLAQKVGGRVGLLNYPLYGLVRKGTGYTGTAAPLNDITAGDTWYWTSKTGYDQTTGVGTLNVANFADALVSLGLKK